MKSSKHIHAFTLIELLVVISIIALLVSILLPALNEARNLARRVVCSSSFHSQGQAYYQYAQESKGMLPPQSYGAPYKTYIMYWRHLLIDRNNNRGPLTLLKPFGLGGLFNLGLITDPRIFYCPGFISVAGHEPEHLYESYIHPVTGEFYFPGPGAPNGMAENYLWGGYHFFKNNFRTLDKMGSRSFSYDLIHNWNMVAHVDSSGKPKGLGALYGDGHALFNTSPELFEEEIWGDGSFGNNPDTSLAMWFAIIARLGNNAPDPFLYDGNLNTPLWENADKWQCNERLEDGAQTGLYIYAY